MYKERVWEATWTEHTKYNCRLYSLRYFWDTLRYIEVLLRYFETEYYQLHALFSQLQDSFPLSEKQPEKTQTPFSGKFQWADAHSLLEKFLPSKRDLPASHGINMKAQRKSNASIIYSHWPNCAIWFLIMPLTWFENFETIPWVTSGKLQIFRAWAEIITFTWQGRKKAKDVALLDNLTAKISSARLCFSFTISCIVILISVNTFHPEV